MFESLSLKNFALFKGLSWKVHGPINIIVGRNDTGKTHLLKVLYCLAKSAEDFHNRRKPDVNRELLSDERVWNIALANKLIWTYQTDDWSQLIHAGAKQAQVEAELHGREYRFGIYPSQVAAGLTEAAASDEEHNAIFIPPKELLTAFDAIAATREKLEIFGFDDTYYDLIRALRLPATRGKIEDNLRIVLLSLESLFSGVISKGEGSDRFVFKRAKQTFSMPQTAEGIKKVGILTTLIHNRTLRPGSILFLDEPETNLHPDYIVALMNMLFLLNAAGIQIYLATHSYFVIKQLHILAKEQQRSVVFCSLTRDKGTVRAEFDDLQHGMPDNPIIAEAVELYRREVALDLKR